MLCETRDAAEGRGTAASWDAHIRSPSSWRTVGQRRGAARRNQVIHSFSEHGEQTLPAAVLGHGLKGEQDMAIVF